jgi:hypothetical protein
MNCAKGANNGKRFCWKRLYYFSHHFFLPTSLCYNFLLVILDSLGWDWRCRLLPAIFHPSILYE